MPTKSKTKTADVDRWKPRRYGKNREIYCSPACGGQCRWADYRAAMKTARETAIAMGPGWRPNVWENLGWHASAKCGEAFEINASRATSNCRRFFTAYLRVGGIQFHAFAEIPSSAYIAALDMAMEHARNVAADCIAAERAGRKIPVPKPRP